MKSAIWTLAAEADVQLLYERLECNELSMGDRFYSEVLATVKLLESLPELGPVVYGDRIRRVLVFNRNYGLFYIVEPRGVIIHALLDLRQDPRQIKKRIVPTDPEG
jgi:plasmid stabilization system protein ParE